jgi:transaldolase/glucose-6-phosphate isomerase
VSTIPRLEFDLGRYRDRVDARLAVWREAGVAERLWARDRTLWFEHPEPELENRLGWLDLPSVDEAGWAEWVEFASEAAEWGVERVVVLGMGGSSLAPEVLQRVLGLRPGFLTVLDSTHPDAVWRRTEELDFEHTLFVVSSKSGSTIETLSLFHWMWNLAGEKLSERARHFAIVTDAGGPLDVLGRERGLRVFAAAPDVGGRYSALSAFGLVPGALAGVDIGELLRGGRAATDLLEHGGEAASPLLEPAAVLGELALAGIDKLTLLTSESLAAFPDWLEQLVAESTGKNGSGILPVVSEGLLQIEEYEAERLFLAFLNRSEQGGALDTHLDDLVAAGHPVGRVVLDGAADLGFEFVRWEAAVALAGSILALNPFSQPNVQLAKKLAQAAMAGDESLGAAIGSLKKLNISDLPDGLRDWLDRASRSPYVAVHAYLAPSEATSADLSALQAWVRRRTGRVTTLGYGPRFLHSTGQLHKGGAIGASFLQITAPAFLDLPIPGQPLSFGELIAAQADGDAAALMEVGQHVVRLELGDVSELHELALEKGERR